MSSYHSYHSYRRAAGDRYVPYKPADGLSLPLRGPSTRGRGRYSLPRDTAIAPPPLPSMKDVVAHRKGANNDAAAALRSILDDDTPTMPVVRVATGANAVASGSSHSTPTGVTSHPYFRQTVGLKEEADSPASGPSLSRSLSADERERRERAAMVAEAWKEKYAIEPSQERGTTALMTMRGARYVPPSRGRYTAKRGSSGQRSQHTFPRTDASTSPKPFRSYEQYDKHGRVQHAGGGDQEDEWRTQNHHLLIGQHGADVETEETGCDIPMPRTASVTAPTVRLDPDLSPLSAEHPARVWNSMLHSLASWLQPIVRWEYDNVMLNGDWAYVARMTIILPPSHPAIANHPVVKALPKNRYAREYAEAMSVLGGVRTWAGPARKLKAYAQNTTITMCISENALAWVHAPVMVHIEEGVQKNKIDSALVDLGMVLIAGTTVSVEIQHDQDIRAYGCRLLVGREPHFQSYAEDTVHPSPEAAENAVRQRAIDLNVRGFLTWLQGTERGTEGIGGAQEMEEADDDLSAEVVLEAASDEGVSLTADAPANDAPPNHDDEGIEIGDGVFVGDESGEAAPGGTEEDESVHPTGPAVHEAVHKTGGLSHSATPIKSKPEAVDLVTPRVVPEEIDWQTQLAYFCHLSDLPPPSYSQRIIRRPGQSTLFLGKVVVEDETYESADGHDNIRAARQSVAQQVFTETFGQEPAAVTNLLPAFQP